jgi:hypothetical protein
MANATITSNQNLRQYTIVDYEEITNAGFVCNLSQETLNIISKLSEQVGAPTYIKTPIFLKKDAKGAGMGSGLGLGLGLGLGAGMGSGMGLGSSSGYKKMKPRANEITDEDWEAIRAFQTTQKHISEGIEKHMDNIRGFLNKITDKNEEAMIRDIKNEISKLITHETSDENMMKIGYSIFNIASSNSFYSELYARLFKSLMKDYDIFKKIFEDNFKEFMSLFNTIEFVDPKKNYDKFCDYTNTNDKRRAMSLFVVNLMINEVIQKEEIVDIIMQIQKLINGYICKPEKTNEVEELTENVFIIITKSKERLSTSENIEELWANIIVNIEFISVLKPKMKEYPSITNKTIFKHMDMLEELKN